MDEPLLAIQRVAQKVPLVDPDFPAHGIHECAVLNMSGGFDIGRCLLLLPLPPARSRTLKERRQGMRSVQRGRGGRREQQRQYVRASASLLPQSLPDGGGELEVAQGRRELGESSLLRDCCSCPDQCAQRGDGADGADGVFGPVRPGGDGGDGGVGAVRGCGGG